jgi:hypothetical protein
MKIQIKQTEIKCDCCSRTIVNPIAGSSLIPDYLQIENIDICLECSVKILSTLLKEREISMDTLKETIDDVQHHYGHYRPNIALL